MKRKTNRQKPAPQQPIKSDAPQLTLKELTELHLDSPEPAKRVDEIVTTIRNLSGKYNYPVMDVFRDWLRTAWALPKNMHVRGDGIFVSLPDTDIDTLNSMKNRYRPEDMPEFAHLVEILLQIPPEFGYYDTPGEVYRRLNPGFNTVPWKTMYLRMLPLSVEEVIEAVFDRMTLALVRTLGRNPYLYNTWLANGWLGTDKDGEPALAIPLSRDKPNDVPSFFLQNIMPFVIEHFHPVVLNHKNYGSSSVILCVAAHLPQWMVDFDMVLFAIADPDPDCILMTQVNALIYNIGCGPLEAIGEVTDDNVSTPAPTPVPSPVLPPRTTPVPPMHQVSVFDAVPRSTASAPPPVQTDHLQESDGSPSSPTSYRYRPDAETPLQWGGSR